jgi:hypothetical protein
MASVLRAQPSHNNLIRKDGNKSLVKFLRMVKFKHIKAATHPLKLRRANKL